ncbi:mechanosensitive channel MscK [Thauera chlorobenzoica]|uniref:Potassium efflux system KefA-like protein n=1 Tax=Thauera chlorobenzoica TaxID=96773 RepID=A0A1H5V8V9_9RHOO|nr:mechanosensitive channel MscK [Thauera chlorobenzoica]APR02912.1 Potassium efflux system KefA-like protein [Thauera chlorobenzoica]SEF83650.1 potassium efflux system protein [Thauera chlorobenzoica]
MHLLRLLVLLLLPLLSLQAAAQAPVPPAAADVRTRLDTLAERKLAEAEHRSAQQALEQALEHLTAAAEYRRQLAALKEKLGSAPARTADARRQLTTLQAGNGHLPEFGADTSPAQLEQRLAERNAALAEWQHHLDEANALLVGSRTGPERAQTEISANQARMAAIEAALKSGREPGRDGRPLGSERRDALAAEWHALEAQTALRREELAGNSLLQDLGQARHDLASLQVQRLGQQIQVLQAAVNARRSANAVEAVETLEAAAGEGGQASAGSLLARETAANQQLSDYLLRTTEHLNTLTQRNLATRQQLDSLNRNRSLIDEQIEVLQGSLLLSRILLEQKRALPRPALDTQLAAQIADIRLYQFEINKQREQLAQPATYAERLFAQAPAEQADGALREQLGALLAARAELLERLNRELSALLNESITLQLNERQLQSTADTLRATLDEQMFWIPSNRPLDLDWLQALPGALQAQLGAIPWRSASTELWTGLQARPFLFLPVLLLTLTLLWRRRWLRARLDGVHADIGYVRRDSQLHTPLAILFNVLLALPVSLLLALAGLALQMDARGQNASLGAALLQMAEAWLVFYTAYRVLEPGGVAERHFHVAGALTHELYLHMRRLGLVVLAVVAIVTITERQPEGLADDVLGLLTLLAGYASMAWLMGRLLVHKSSATRPSPLRAVLAVALALMPLALIGALLTGYYYTALKLTGRLIDTLFVLIAWRLLGAMFRRALEVAARRLVYQRAVERREAAEHEGRIGADGDDIADSPSLDVDKINQQSLRLLRLGLLGALLVALYWVWADLITVFAYLDNIVLYQFTAADGSSGTPISLRDVLGALLIGGIAFILAANLPGLLEVLVLSRMKLAQGSAYAATTLLSYVIAGVGIVATFGALGVSWDKLQWLVAALSVGLGFGLQEIFANFVSGLIILFERPVRIGDVVTIGNVSGTVSRIQIRATTITDFDRKEIIVPNKAFITGQLINWSLTDTVTRVTVRVGVAYGSDLELTRRLLLQIAGDNPRVLDEPAPLALFLAFGPSTLDHELRIHVRELVDRNAAIDEINRAIDRLFREHGIEIAFNQMDVHIRSVADGREAKLQTVMPPPAGEGSGSGQ